MADQKSDDLSTRLLIAAAQGDGAGVTNALERGAMVDARDVCEATLGRTPLMLAAEAGHVAVVQALLEAGADLNASDDPGGRPVPGVAYWLREGGLEALDEAKYQLNRTALMLAANGAQTTVMSVLLAAGANIHHKDYTSCTALHLAARCGNAESVRLLLANGAKPDERGPNRQTPLSLATQSGSLESVRLLLDARADVTTRDSDRRSVFDIAAQAGNADLVGLLVDALSKGPKTSSVLSRAVAFALLAEPGMPEERVLSVVEQLIAAGAADFGHVVYGMTPLCSAAQKGFERVAAMLLSAGAEVDPPEPPAGSPLRSAVLFQHIGIVKLLLEHGADPNLCDDEGKSALDYARERVDAHQGEAIFSLLKQYADASVRPEKAKTAASEKKGARRRPPVAIAKKPAIAQLAREKARGQSLTDLGFITVRAAAERAGSERFYRNVKAAVIPQLIKKGLLRGKKENRRQLVADDESLARIMRLGIEPFVYNRQGYSFTAVRAPIDDVSSQLRSRQCVARYELRVEPQTTHNYAEAEPYEDQGQAFLVQMRNAPKWSVLILTLDGFSSCDSVMVTALASALSRQMETIAAASWDDDADSSDPSLVVCRDGNLVQAISDEGELDNGDEDEGWARYYAFFYEQGIYLPEAMIGGGPENAKLYVADPTEVERADLFVFKTPRAVPSQGLFVPEKCGTMSQSATDDLDKYLDATVWRESQALLAGGEF